MKVVQEVTDFYVDFVSISLPAKRASNGINNRTEKRDNNNKYRETYPSVERALITKSLIVGMLW